MGAKLVVREGQAAVFVNEGKIADVFKPGTYTLETQNLPILSDLKGWKYGFNRPFKAEVYFVATRQFTDFKWGTQNPIMLRDAEFGMVRLRAFGTYAMRVTDPAKLLRQLVGTDPQFRTDEVGGVPAADDRRQTRPRPSAAAKIPVLDLAANQGRSPPVLATGSDQRARRVRPAASRGSSSRTSRCRPRSRRRWTSARDGRRSAISTQYTQFQAANAIERRRQQPERRRQRPRPRRRRGPRPTGRCDARRCGRRADGRADRSAAVADRGAPVSGHQRRAGRARRGRRAAGPRRVRRADAGHARLAAGHAELGRGLHRARGRVAVRATPPPLPPQA